MDEIVFIRNGKTVGGITTEGELSLDTTLIEQLNEADENPNDPEATYPDEEAEND